MLHIAVNKINAQSIIEFLSRSFPQAEFRVLENGSTCWIEATGDEAVVKGLKNLITSVITVR